MTDVKKCTRGIQSSSTASKSVLKIVSKVAFYYEKLLKRIQRKTK